MKKRGMISFCLCAALVCGCQTSRTNQQNYGVYIGCDDETLPSSLHCDLLVIDAQFFDREEIEALHQDNRYIYSYFNIGSLEDYRDYYETYEDITLCAYENWPQERWVDISQEQWQEFLCEDLAPALIEKGIDGFFVDNVDVYDIETTEGVYEGMTHILTSLKEMGADVIINGGDGYVKECINRHCALNTLLDGVNQEGVFTAYQWDSGMFLKNDDETRNYYLDYLDLVSKQGVSIYLIEYTNDALYQKVIEQECRKRGYVVTVTDRIELDGQ